LEFVPFTATDTYRILVIPGHRTPGDRWHRRRAAQLLGRSRLDGKGDPHLPGRPADRLWRISVPCRTSIVPASSYRGRRNYHAPLRYRLIGWSS